MWRVSASSLAVYFLSINYVHAYVGPGLGLGALGVILGILLSVILAIVGIFWYPIKRIFKKSSRRSDSYASDTQGDND